MGTVSQEQFRDFLSGNINAINQVQQELDEIQSGFTSRFMEFKADHDATLVRLTNKLLPNLDTLGPALQQRIQQQYAEERKAAHERRTELQQLIPAAEKKADKLLKQAQEQIAKIRKLNPEYDEREERIKAEIEQLRAGIADYNTQIQKLNKGLGFLFNFFKADRVDKERQKLVGQFKAQQKALHDVRSDWDKKQKTFTDKQTSYQEAWREQNISLASMRAEAEHLADDTRLEELARKRAVYKVLDDLKDPELCEGSGEFEQELRDMLLLNHQTDNYMEGLKSVAGLIAWLGSVTEGMESIHKSINSMISQQRQHSAHLKPLKINIPDIAQNYADLWGTLQERVKDDARLCKIPLEFVDTVKPTMESALNQEQITALFDQLGDSLKRAAAAWG